MPSVSVTAPLAPITIESPFVNLRPWSPGDLDCVSDASTDPAIPSMTTVPAIFTPESGLAFVARQHGRLVAGEGWALAMARPGTDDAVGHIGLWLHQVWKGRVEIGYWVRPSARGRGFAGAALSMLTQWAFDHLDEVHRVGLSIEPSNTASIRTAEGAGFTREALLHHWEVIEGQPRDMWSYRRLRRE
ncbi:MAG: GNAT family N-acetyltransferase [Actinomycetota bacterium]